jgi:hypothetical protein
LCVAKATMAFSVALHAGPSIGLRFDGMSRDKIPSMNESRVYLFRKKDGRFTRSSVSRVAGCAEGLIVALSARLNALSPDGAVVLAKVGPMGQAGRERLRSVSLKVIMALLAVQASIALGVAGRSIARGMSRNRGAASYSGGVAGLAVLDSR